MESLMIGALVSQARAAGLRIEADGEMLRIVGKAARRFEVRDLAMELTKTEGRGARIPSDRNVPKQTNCRKCRKCKDRSARSAQSAFSPPMPKCRKCSPYRYRTTCTFG